MPRCHNNQMVAFFKGGNVPPGLTWIQRAAGATELELVVLDAGL